LAESVINASQCYKGVSRSEEAHKFITKQLTKIVSIILDRVDIGDANEEEKPITTDCLESALVVVSHDLAHASMTGSASNILQVLLDIFDEVAGFDDCNNNLIFTFREADGLRNLGCYLSKLKDSFPSFNAINTILQVVRTSYKAGVGENREEETKYAGSICYQVMLYLLSLDDDSLTHCSDDAIDLCRWVQKIFTDLSKFDDNAHLPLFFSDYRTFILKLLKSSHLTSRVAGSAEVRTLSRIGLQHRPPPRLYTVKGQANQELNGVYEIDPGATLKEALLKDYEDVVYIKKPSNEVKDSSDIQPESGDTRLHLHRWIQRCNINIPEATHTQSSQSGYSFDDGLAIGFHGSDTLEHDFVRWLTDNDILGLLERKSESDWELSDARYAARTSIERILEFALNSIPKSDEFEIGDRLTSEDIEKAISSAADHGLSLTGLQDQFESFWANVCNTSIHYQRVSDFDVAYMLDHHIFHRISVLKLMFSYSSQDRKLASKWHPGLN
jgi:hypothetical protein